MSDSKADIELSLLEVRLENVQKELLADAKKYLIYDDYILQLLEDGGLLAVYEALCETDENYSLPLSKSDRKKLAAMRQARKAEIVQNVSDALREKSKKAADARHSQPGGSRDKRKEMQKIWANGNYSSRDICAEQECADLGMSFSTARKALRNTPDPSPWPAKEK